MSRFFSNTCTILLLFATCCLQAQPGNRSDISSEEPVPYGLSVKEWNKLQIIWSKRNYPVTLKFINDSTISGQILFRDDTMLVLWTDTHSFFNPRLADSLIKIYPESTIDKITAFRNTSFKPEESGMMYGTVAGFLQGFIIVLANGGLFEMSPVTILPAIGLGAGAIGDLIRTGIRNSQQAKIPFNIDLLGKKKEKAYYMFTDSLPGAMIRYEGDSSVIRAENIDLVFKDILEISPQARRIFSLPKFSIGGHYGTGYTKNFSQWGKLVSFSAGYRFSRRCAIGYTCTVHEPYYLDAIAVSSSVYENINLNQTGHMLSFSYAPLAIDGFLSKRFQLNAGMGIVADYVDYSVDYYTLVDNSNYGVFYEYDKKLLMGVDFMANLEFYFSRVFSIWLGTERSFIAPMKSDEVTTRDENTGILYNFNSSTVDPSMIDIQFGFHIHF